MTTTILFKKIHNNHNRLRADEITGKWQREPKIGEQFVMFGKATDPRATGRLVNTSIVTELETIDNGWALHTESGSLYHVTLLQA